MDQSPDFAVLLAVDRWKLTPSGWERYTSGSVHLGCRRLGRPLRCHPQGQSVFQDGILVGVAVVLALLKSY